MSSINYWNRTHPRPICRWLRISYVLESADTAISLVAPGKYFVLTEEVALYSLLSANGVDVMNFNHVRLAA